MEPFQAWSLRKKILLLAGVLVPLTVFSVFFLGKSTSINSSQQNSNNATDQSLGSNTPSVDPRENLLMTQSSDLDSLKVNESPGDSREQSVALDAIRAKSKSTLPSSAIQLKELDVKSQRK